MENNGRPRIKRQPQQFTTDGFVSARRPALRSYTPAQQPAQSVFRARTRPASPTPPKQSPSARPGDAARYRSMVNSTIPIAAALAPAETPVEPSHRRFGRKPKKPKAKKSLARKVVFRSAIVSVLLIASVGGFLGFKALHSIDKVFHGNIISDATAAFSSTPLKGESTGRVNILLAGDSADQIDHGGADLTDSILLLSIDTQNHTAFLLSIPRDLWVYIPGMSSWQKINAANTVTNFNEAGYPSGGMGQLEQIIESDFGIPIDYYGLMDYGAFRDAVNAVGGVTITVNSPDPRGLYDPNTDLKLPNGPVTLDGQQALNLARARGDGYGSYGFPDSDFDRTQHQRQLFTAVAQKAATIGVLGNPVKVSDLINTLGSNFQTDLTLQNVLRLIQITKGVNLGGIQSYAFSSTLSGNSDPILQGYTDPVSGEDALIPTNGIGNYGQMEQYYKLLTSNNPVAKESPSVAIINGSNVVGLAAKQRSILQGDDVNVSAIATATNEYPTTMIVDNTNGAKPNSLKLLQKLYPGSTVTSDTGSTEAGEAQGYTSDFVVILGENWNTSSSTTAK